MDNDRKVKVAERLNEAFDIIGIKKGHGRNTEVAKMFKVSRQAAARWCTGEGMPSDTNINEISERSGLSYEYLMTGRERRSTQSKVIDMLTGKSPVDDLAQESIRDRLALSIRGTRIYQEKITIDELAKRTGLDPFVIRDVEKQNIDPRDESDKRGGGPILDTICKGLNITVPQLYTQMDSLLLGGFNYERDSTRMNRDDRALSINPRIVDIPIHDYTKAAAGNGLAVWEDGPTGNMSIPESVLRGAGVAPSTALRFILVEGDSMAGTFNSGDLILVDTKVDHLAGDGIYVFRFDDCLYVKRIRTNFSSNKVEIISDNSAYPPQEWNDKIKILARVVRSLNWETH